MKRILFAGYAPVHVVCFMPVHSILSTDQRIDLWFSGGFLHKDPDGDRYIQEDFYDDFPVRKDRIIPVEQAKKEDFDVVVCSHLSTDLFPRSAKKSVEIFHGVSFKNFSVREKALSYDYLCIPGNYHANAYREHGLIREGGSACLLTGFPKVDALVSGSYNRESVLSDLGLDPELPTLLYAPTGGKKNSLEIMGEEVIKAIRDDGSWNLLVKPHDHPKNKIDWFSRLSPLVNTKVKLVQDKNVVPYLFASDLLISDASSVTTEYSLLDRPIIFLDVPNLIEKTMQKSDAMDLDTYGRKIGRTVSGSHEVVEAIRESLAHHDADQSALRKSMAQDVFYDPGNAAERVANVIRYAAGIDENLHPDIQVLEPENKC